LAARAAILKRRAVFELPRKLGILQYVEYEPPPREWCTNDGYLYEGMLTAEGCRKVVVNGVELDQLYCRTVEDCVRQILEEYKREVEKMKEPPAPPPSNMAEELLKEWPELQAFGVDWVRKWVVLKERLVEIAKVLRRFPWMVEVVRQRPMNILHPYMIEVYVAKDGSEVCLSLNPPKAFCAQNGSVKETRSLSSAGTRH
jgi:hypothetical protein